MTSRQRMLLAMDHREPDRVPIDLNSTIVTSLTRVAYGNLRDHLGLERDNAPSVSHFAMDTIRAREDLLEHYGVDTRTVGLRAPDRPRDAHLPDGTYRDEYGHRWKQASYYWELLEHPLANVPREGLDAAAWPDEHDSGRYRGLREEARRLRDSTDKCIVFDIPGLGPFEGGCFLRGHADFCVDLYEDPRYAEALLDKVTDSMILFWGHALEEAGEYVDVVAQGDDVGMQTAPFLSVEMYRRFIKPRKKRLFDFIHARTKAKIFYHSCGSVYDYMPDFIEEGVDILNPVQTSAAKMDLRTLKREFGRDLCFWGGGIDVQKELPFLSPAEIERVVAGTLEVMAPGGGYVFFPSHNIQADTTPDRIDAMFRAAVKHGGY